YQLVLHSFPTRRSSDLVIFEDGERLTNLVGCRLKKLVLELEARSPSEDAADIEPFPFDLEEHVPAQNPLGWDGVMGAAGRVNVRSEEHTSELQSRGHLV